MKTLVYVLASGRSGSTLLDKFLNAHPRISGFGEIGRLPHVEDNGPNYCGCSLAINECDVWNPVLKEAQKKKDWGFEEWTSFLMEYLFTENDFVVDSSGSLKRLKKLIALNSNSFSIKVIYLHRNPFGVIYSMNKKGKRVTGKKTSLFRATVGWSLRNAKM